MAMWRVLKPLSKGHDRIIPAGSVVALEWLNTDRLGKLQQVGAISRLTAPPLHKFPGWQTRSKRLNQAGVNGVEPFLEADNEWLAEKLKLKPATVARWKEELIDRYLTAPQRLRR
jgi:hypothetical protein